MTQPDRISAFWKEFNPELAGAVPQSTPLKDPQVDTQTLVGDSLRGMRIKARRRPMQLKSLIPDSVPDQKKKEPREPNGSVLRNEILKILSSGGRKETKFKLVTVWCLNSTLNGSSTRELACKLKVGQTTVVRWLKTLAELGLER